MLKNKLKEYRLLCSYSQQQVADVLNIHRSTYSYYELGKTEPSIENIRVLAGIFGVSLNDLLEVELPASLQPGMSDPGYDGEFEYLNEDRVNRVGDLTRDEKKLIMRFRLLTEKQRKDMLKAMSDPSEGAEDPGNKG